MAFRSVIFVVMMLVSGHSFSAEHDLEKYIKTVESGSWSQKVSLYKKLYEYSGVSDEKLFDKIAAQVEAKMGSRLETKPEAEEYHWGIKSLASSGQFKYQALLTRIYRETNNSMTKRHTDLARNRLPEFTVWNKVISSTEFETAERSGKQGLWMRFLSHGDLKMASFAVRTAQKELSFHDDEFSDLAMKRLTEMYPQKTRDRYSLEYQSWACKYLMLSHNSDKYRPLIAEISTNSPNRKVAKWAKKSLSY